MKFYKKNKFNYKNFLLLFFFVVFIFFASVNSANAKISDWLYELHGTVVETGTYGIAPGADTTELWIAQYIGYVLLIAPFIGVIFIIQMVLAGYSWMTAAGDSEKIEEAKKRIINAVIGTIIFSVLYIIAYFIVNSLLEATKYGG